MVERDLGIVVSASLKTRDHTAKVCASARGIIGAIRRSFTKLSPATFKSLFAAHVRPRLEFGGVVAYPCTKAEMGLIERVQRSATRLVVGMRQLSYEHRLFVLGLFPQHYRRLRGDLIWLRKLIRGDCGLDLQALFPLRNDSSKRGHQFTLKKQPSDKTPASWRLSRRVVNVWNSLPAAVVEEVSDVKFKSLLDIHLEVLWRQDL